MNFDLGLLAMMSAYMLKPKSMPELIQAQTVDRARILLLKAEETFIA